MKIIAVRDILIGYYLTPFCTFSASEALGGIAAVINNEENQDAIAKTPSHFQVWQLGEITPEGEIVPKLELLADCRSLVRPLERESSDRGTDPELSPERREQLRVAFNERRSPQNGESHQGMSGAHPAPERPGAAHSAK